MVVNKFSPVDQARELMKFLQSSNLHFTAQVTPFSMYITVRKKFRNTSHCVIQEQVEPSKISIPKETIESWKSELENNLKQKDSECHELERSLNLLKDKLEKAADVRNDLEAELEEKCVESHELKSTNSILQEKLQTAEAKFLEYSSAASEETVKLAEKVEFLGASVMRSTEETLNMERKLIEAKKVIKKFKSEKLDILEKPKVSNNSKLVISKNTQTDLSSFSSSPGSSTPFSVSDNDQHCSETGALKVSCPRKAESMKSFPPFSSKQDLEPFNLFPPFGNVMPGQLFSGQPFPPYQDGNNNPKAVIKKSEALNETEFENVRDSTRAAIKNVSSSFKPISVISTKTGKHPKLP
jgi:hypothetical protein